MNHSRPNITSGNLQTAIEILRAAGVQPMSPSVYQPTLHGILIMTTVFIHRHHSTV